MEQPHENDHPPLSPSVEENEQAELFTAVLSTLDREQLPILAAAVLRRLQPGHGPIANPAIGEPVYGSYHVLFPLTFDSGVRWIAKFPINGTESKWNELSASALTSEASTMRLLKRETTIPVPEVLDFSSTTKNSLRCPYIIMSFVTGTPLYNIWFGHRMHGVDPETTRSRRIRALEDIASAMAQLEKFSFQTGGSLVFGSDGSPSGIGPMRRVDQKAMIDRWFVHQNPDDDLIHLQCGAFSSPKKYYTHMLDVHPEEYPIPKGIAILLRHFISWVPEPGDTDPFVLAHPDYNIQNFMVSEDGGLQGIIDWDGVAAVPCSLGNESYPGWLTRDWDSAMYSYTESMEDGVEPDGVWEDSPKDLVYYRSIYDGLMAKHRPQERKGSGINFCRMSLITENLAIAVDDPRCRNGILRRMLDEIWAVAGEGEQPEFTELAESFVEGNVDEKLLETLRRGFNILLSKQGL
ncbi:phosphotransferase family protein [Aspergillus mulundensis]|uniref:Aminoglycoside phosphotransferase domain-containing protein n=1 Tax=Aspergillus mulundensis TaxID=1810919 RepID=A0A3D8T5I1_9EURO|nr:Uncharacterized protein DSM5745_01137 [Aspergillus mulundensis]RDW93815.1 Uncharacterized protein DSM5745_01137 [Aspergillus mulundensis]